MALIVEKFETVTEVIDFLQQKLAEGNLWVVYDTDHPIGSCHELSCFFYQMDAMAHASEYQQIFNWHQAVPLEGMLNELRQMLKDWSLEPRFDGEDQSGLSLKINNMMNKNNLDNLTAEMKKLGFDKSMIEEMEAHMKANKPAFKLYDRVDAAQGVVDLMLHFKQSTQSDYYYLNRLEALHNQGRVLTEGEKFNVLIKTEGGKTNPTKAMDSMAEAVEYFKSQTGDALLVITKGRNVEAEIATMENGKVNYVNNAFKRDYATPPLSQTFWLDHGKGFDREQAINLVQGRAVYREDLLTRDGNPYKAWMQLDNEKARDNSGNLSFRQYSDAYGFDVKTQLDQYKILGMDDVKKMEHLEQVLKNGGRPLVSVEKDGQEIKLYLETSVRYGKLNFYAENGKPEKREQFQKETGLELAVFSDKSKEKFKEKAQEQSIGR